MSGLYSRLVDYKKQDIYPFHMPGHKRNLRFMPDSLLYFDITEIPGMDNLRNPDGLILELEEKIAAVCKSSKSFISVNGSSGGILAAIFATVKEGDELLVARNSHVAAYSGLVASGASPVYVYPKVTHQSLCGGISKQDIKDTLASNSNIKAVFITSPTYEGFCSDIKGIAEIAHQFGKILIVDEAHGAHFGFHPAFPTPAIAQGADISIQSLHKTLPSLGQSSVVHIGDNIDAKKVKQALNVLMTTSPSYIFLVGIDYLFSKTLKDPFDIFDKYVHNLTEFAESVKHFEHIFMPAEKSKGKFEIADIDIGKLIFCIKNGGLTGVEISSILAKDYRVQVEAAFLKHIIAMTSIADSKEGFARLRKGLNAVCEMLKFGNECDIINNYAYNKAEVALTPRQAFSCDRELLPLNKSIGKICGEFIVAYPPGIPLIAPGEIITQEISEKIGRKTIYVISNNVW